MPGPLVALAAAVALASTSCPSVAVSGYARREPEKTVHHVVVRENLETFLATVRHERAKPLPRYVENELRRYVRCGVLAHGFCRVACRTCGEEILVGYSCKCRGTCPSCAARRMCGTAAHLVDHVLPDTPTRQWVLTAPPEVRHVMALRPDALTACNRIFATEVSRWQKAAADIEGAETGSVTFVQRFHSALGVFVHFHLVAPDGVFAKQDGRVTFHAGRAPTGSDIETVARRVAVRMTKWLRKRGLLAKEDDGEQSNETPEPSAIEACIQLSLFGATYARVEDGIEWPMREARGGSDKSPWARSVEGYDVHAGVTVRRDDRAGLERLCRYGARPAFSLERLSLLENGRVAYLLKKPRRGGATHLVMTPVQFLARIAALVPPPRYPLVRFAGVFGPCSTWRRAVVAMRPAVPPSVATIAARAGVVARPERRKKLRRTEPATPLGTLPLGSRDLHERHDSRLALTTDDERLTADVRPCYSRIDWASLLRRVYMEDVLACPCGGRRRIVAHVQDRDVVVEILTHLGIDANPPTIARARDPTFDDVA